MSFKANEETIDVTKDETIEVKSEEEIVEIKEEESKPREEKIFIPEVKPIRNDMGITTSFEIDGDYPKYGNDDDRVDNIAKWLTEYFINEWKADKVIELLKTTTLTQKEIGKQVGWNRSAVTMINIGENHFRENEKYPIRK